ncbi:tetratricopeptide repeat protein [Novosphingobium sp.]|uniref:tetratricopeptide repeat protein n=1 Tax=Novosphingobium sp. TaxID=1874826 RepID=UPI003B51BF8E
MTWVVIIALAAIVFALLVFVFKMPRAGWEITGAALLFGLAGYAVQGHPGVPGVPKAAVENQRIADATMLQMRQQMGARFSENQSWLLVADALVRQGQFRASADFLSHAVSLHPNDPDLWVALGNSLTGHSDGTITPAAKYAFDRAARINPAHPGPPFFEGMALVQSGHLAQGRAMWADLLKRSPPDAAFHADLAARLARLDQLIAMSEGKGPPPVSPDAVPADAQPGATPPAR